MENYKLNKRQILTIVFFFLFNILAYTFAIKTATKFENAKLAFLNLIFVVPFICLVLGFLISFIPIKQKSFKERYFRSIKLLWFLINGLMSFCLLSLILMNILNWYPLKDKNQLEIKERTISNFTSQIRSLTDSIGVYADNGSSKIKEGKNVDSIIHFTNFKISSFQEKIEKKGNSFIDTAKRMGISDAEIKQVILEFAKYGQITKGKIKDYRIVCEALVK